MNRDMVERIQDRQYEMLLEIRRICEKYEISYFLCCGTLLGAARHNGPIPWDDDLDVGLLRSEYERFLLHAQKELSDRYFLQTWHTDAGYALPHCKIRDKNSHYVEKVNAKSGCMDGISVDVLPFDAIPNTMLVQRLHGFLLNDIMNLVKLKRNWIFIRENRVSPVREKIYRILACCISENSLIRLYEKICTAYNGNIGFPMVSEAAGLDYFRFIARRSDYLKTKEMRYRDELFRVPRRYKALLRKSYGDYMRLPPMQERTGQPEVMKVTINE